VPVTLRSIQLFFQEGSSDKVYEAEIIEDEGAFTVKVSWGRRGAKLNQGNKAVRVSEEAAHKKFDALVREKRAKGYEERTEERQPAPVAPPEGTGSGSKVQGRRERLGQAAQLLNPIEDHELEAFLTDDEMIAQQKLDGKRVIAHVGEEVVLTNRNGEITTAKPHLIEGLLHLPDGTIVDGEVVGEGDSSQFWLFDVLAVGGVDLREKGYLERWQVLAGDLEPGLTGAVKVLAVASGEASKRALLQSLQASQAEGIVFKRRDAPYKSGRPASGGTQRKYKLVKSADVVILENAGNAYLMGVYDGSTLVEVGKVFAGTTNDSRKELDQLLAKGERPVAEVRFLYATEDKQLFQPVFVHLRTDKPPQECGYAQLVGTSRQVLSL
jgi:bifunctional non-homologous end joining protein LigD